MCSFQKRAQPRSASVCHGAERQVWDYKMVLNRVVSRVAGGGIRGDAETANSAPHPPELPETVVGHRCGKIWRVEIESTIT